MLAVERAFALGAVAGCDKLWEEIHWALTRKCHLPADVVADDLEFYRGHSLDIKITGSVRGSVDPDDDFILECAVKAGARAIVSNDLKHLVRMQSFECIPILTPPEYLV